MVGQFPQVKAVTSTVDKSAIMHSSGVISLKEILAIVKQEAPVVTKKEIERLEATKIFVEDIDEGDRQVIKGNRQNSRMIYFFK